MRSIIVLLAASMTLVGMPVAAADEAHPDCEDGQPLVGYRSTLFLRDLLEGNPAGLYACEGEHWDGQDTVQGDEAASCTPTVSAVPDDLFVAFCQGSDPNAAPSLDASQPLAVRVGSANYEEAYASTNIGGVGRAVLYVGPEMTAVYVRDNTPGNVLATAVSAPGITQGYVSENDCDQATYQGGAMAGDRTRCGRDNTAVTVQYARLLP
ncbi:MAG TPA: hypothetical protein VFH78_12280 [Candidatus Thermoplasmatota archaeon]|nr:hypothetical protein [Candidatus Thermoplasmatota archaeon]